MTLAAEFAAAERRQSQGQRVGALHPEIEAKLTATQVRQTRGAIVQVATELAQVRQRVGYHVKALRHGLRQHALRPTNGTRDAVEHALAQLLGCLNDRRRLWRRLNSMTAFMRRHEAPYEVVTRDQLIKRRLDAIAPARPMTAAVSP